MPKSQNPKSKFRFTRNVWHTALDNLIDQYEGGNLTPSEKELFVTALESINDVYTSVVAREERALIAAGKLFQHA